MASSLRTPLALAGLTIVSLGCAGSDASQCVAASLDDPAARDLASCPPDAHTLRYGDRALVKWLASTAADPWWIEERLAPQPMVVGDRDLGPRAIVRTRPARDVVYLPPDADRLTDACRHPSGEWTAVGVSADRRVFVARGDGEGLMQRALLEDDALVDDAAAYLDEPRTVPRVGYLSEASPAVAAVGEDVVVSLMSEDNAILAYRLRWEQDGLVVLTRTLVSPALVVTPFLPIGGSYDDFDAVVAPFLPRLGADVRGRAYVAMFADRNRVTRHNAVFGTALDLLRDQLAPRENTLDTLVVRVDADGSHGFATVVGTADYEDETFGIAVGSRRVAVFGRRRRELGRDNTELHAVVAELDHDGTPGALITYDGPVNAIALAAAYDGPRLWVAPTVGWSQNPSGRSVGGQGSPRLLAVDGPDDARVVTEWGALVPATMGHAELRALGVAGGFLFLGGHENGPVTHTGDVDPSLIRSDVWLAVLPR